MRREMKHNKRRMTGRFLGLTMLMLCMLLFAVPTALAEEEWTQEDAIEYINSLIGQKIDVDNGKFDCVDIAKIYFKTVGKKDYVSLGSFGDGTASEYATKESDIAIPNGWVRKYYVEGYRPQPGDVAVWGKNVGRSGSAGHVAVVYSTDGKNIRVVDQDSDLQRCAELSQDIPASEPTCYIVPVFNLINRYTVLVLDISNVSRFYVGNNDERYYESNSSIETVKESAKKFLLDARESLSESRIAIVTYADEAKVVIGFTDDYDALKNALDSVSVASIGRRSIGEGLSKADELLNRIRNANVTKNVILCTTGFTDTGKYNYIGDYSESTVGSRWRNRDTEIRIYAYSNHALEVAKEIKKKGITIYVIGLFDPIVSALSITSETNDIISLLYSTAKDLATSLDTFYETKDPKDLEFAFGELKETVVGSAEKSIKNDCDKYRDSSTQKEHTENVLWGPSLFEISSSQLYQSSVNSPDAVSHNLALLCGNLCMTAANPDYLVKAYQELGFKEENIYLYSYPKSVYNRSDASRNGSRFASDEDLAFSIVTQPMVINGVSSDVVIITARGTMTTWEAIKDATCLADKEFYGYKAWDWIWEFEEDVFAGLDDFYREHSWLGTRPLKILVTGHSLGGACANLVAAKLNMECGKDHWYSKNVTPDDIFAYTFGAIDSICDEKYDGTKIEVPVTNGFSNIINIYNYMDTFGPYGRSYLTARGNSLYGKFGSFYTFLNANPEVYNSDCATHEMLGYLQAVKDGQLKANYKNNVIRVCIMCPVDITVYCGEEMVCKIVSEQIVTANRQIDSCIEDGRKVFILPKDDYRFIVSAYDEGNMCVVIQDVENTVVSSRVYDKIVLQEGKQFECILPKTSPNLETQIFVCDETGNHMAGVELNGTETLLKTEPVEEVKNSPIEIVTENFPEVIIPSDKSEVIEEPKEHSSSYVMLILFYVVGEVIIVLGAIYAYARSGKRI